MRDDLVKNMGTLFQSFGISAAESNLYARLRSRTEDWVVYAVWHGFVLVCAVSSWAVLVPLVPLLPQLSAIALVMTSVAAINYAFVELVSLAVKEPYALWLEKKLASLAVQALLRVKKP